MYLTDPLQHQLNKKEKLHGRLAGSGSHGSSWPPPVPPSRMPWQSSDCSTLARQLSCPTTTGQTSMTDRPTKSYIQE
jgi:hypothetical protein